MWPTSRYGWPTPVASLTLSATQPELIEPLTVGEAKRYLRVDFPDDDLLIGSLISAAREQAEYAQGRALVRKSYDLTISDVQLWHPLDLVTPLVTVDTVEQISRDGTATAFTLDTDYRVDLPRQALCLFPQVPLLPYSSLLVRITVGYAPTDPFWQHVGARLKTGMLLLVSLWYTNRLPFAPVMSVSEYPYAVTHCLTSGALRRAR